MMSIQTEMTPAKATSEPLESFRRIRGERLVDRFYDEFLKAEPRILSLFAQTDAAHQKRMLQHGLLMMLRFALGDSVSKLAIKRLGQRHHVELEIPVELYQPFVDSLMKSVASLDPEWSPRLDRAWREHLSIGITEMKRYAKS